MSKDRTREENPTEKSLRNLSTAIVKRSKREAILEILQSNSRLDRAELVAGSYALQQDVARFMSPDAALLLLNTILHLDPKALDNFLKGVSPTARKFLTEMNALYRPLFEGIVGYPDDWYRVVAVARYDFSTGAPIVYLEVFKKSGEHVSLTTSFDDLMLLVNSVLKQVVEASPGLSKLGYDTSKSESLKETKEIVDSLISPRR
jgi:hypothetical protein